MSEQHLGDVDSRSGALIIHGLDFLQLADPGDRVATAVPRVMVTSDPDSWGLRVEQLPETSFAVHGERSTARFGIWDRVTIRFATGGCTERRQVGEILSTAGCFVVLDPAITGQLRGPSTHADVACWGSSARRIAHRLGLEQLGPDTYGYRNVPIDAAPALERRIRAVTSSWQVARVTTHPRTEGYLLQHQLDTADATVATLGPQRLVAFRAHQDGSWPAFAELAHDGTLLALAISFAT